jgi:multisubunit Na+/H+ antiporter MnhE subunit
MKNIITELLSVKSIVTLTLILTVAFLAIRQNVVLPSEFIVGVITSVITYYFTRKTGGNKE